MAVELLEAMDDAAKKIMAIMDDPPKIEDEPIIGGDQITNAGKDVDGWHQQRSWDSGNGWPVVPWRASDVKDECEAVQSSRLGRGSPNRKPWP